MISFLCTRLGWIHCNRSAVVHVGLLYVAVSESCGTCLNIRCSIGYCWLWYCPVATEVRQSQLAVVKTCRWWSWRDSYCRDQEFDRRLYVSWLHTPHSADIGKMTFVPLWDYSDPLTSYHFRRIPPPHLAPLKVVYVRFVSMATVCTVPHPYLCV